MNKEIDLNQIKKLLPHREPMLLIEKISNIVSMQSATGHISVQANKFFLMVIFLDSLFFQEF